MNIYRHHKPPRLWTKKRAHRLIMSTRRLDRARAARDNAQTTSEWVEAWSEYHKALEERKRFSPYPLW